jgi:hypothetical protein
MPRRPERIFLLVAACIGTILVGADLIASAGHVLFTQDDPYIHLALAQRLLHSVHYGLNPGEPAAPASSILYPFLLVPFLALGLGPASALVVCVAATCVTILLLCSLLREAGYPIDAMPPATLFLVAVCWLFGFNLIGVALTGMEHSLQIALVLACALGLLRLFRGGHPPWFLLVAAGLLPVVRYEGVALWLICVAALAWWRFWTAALLTLLPTALALAGFSLFLVSNGLPPLPSSVLAKAGSGMLGAQTAGGNAIAIVLHNFHENLSLPGCLPLIALALVNLAAIMVPAVRRHPSQVAIALAGAAICLAHVVAGKFGGFGRYEAYAEIFGSITALIAYAPVLVPQMTQGGPVPLTMFAVLPLILFGYVVQLQVRAPIAAANIYAQQYQLHRFAVSFWRGPVAINDLGEVSYDNPYYVLDYAGLGSEPARLARTLVTRDPRWMDDLARAHGVRLAMIFQSWFPDVPPGWKLVARLHLGISDIVAGDKFVNFYATTADAAGAIAALGPAFAVALPKSASLEIVR